MACIPHLDAEGVLVLVAEVAGTAVTVEAPDLSEAAARENVARLEPVACGVWRVARGVWPVACGVWCVVCGTSGSGEVTIDH